MKNEFPISNLRAKYADKTADGKDISEAIAEAQTAGDIPELTEETAEEIYKTKPKFIKYLSNYYTLQEDATPDLYYTSPYNEYSFGICITEEDGAYAFEKQEFYPASTDYVDQNKGTKLYRHEMRATISDVNYTFEFINNDSTAYTSLPTALNGQRDFLTFNFYSGSTTLRNCVVSSGFTLYGIGNSGLASQTIDSPIRFATYTDTVTPL